MNITLETIDDLRERTNASYSEAKEALEQTNGNLIDAIIYLEKKGVSSSKKGSSKKNDFNKKTKSFFNSMGSVNFDLIKKDKISLRLPLPIFILIALIGMPFVVVGLIIAILMGYKIEFTKNGEKINEINETLNKMSETVTSHIKENE
ncbi:DUF4342 domain-containing protein [Clostridiaceae bacterium HSG29]|nr:DUF4342 domain-containing protein [Clostridiaceae bacterium HSG29]